MSVKPKHFSEIFNDASSLAKAIPQVTNHDFLACGKCNEPIRTLREQETLSSPYISGYIVKFCTKCGTEIDWSEIRKDWDVERMKEYKKCDKCHIDFHNEELFCVHCGKSLKVIDPKKKGFLVRYCPKSHPTKFDT